MGRNTHSRTNRGLWLAFGVLFAVVAAASVGPVEPIVWILPAWAVVVVAATVVAATAAAIAGVIYGWPAAEADENGDAPGVDPGTSNDRDACRGDGA